MPRKNKIIFFYPSGPRLTGQELASRLILELLRDEGDIDFQIVKLAAFNREQMFSLRQWYQFISSAFFACYQMVLTIFKRNSVVYMNLGQSMKSLILEGMPFGITGMFNPWRRSVISLHGNFFMEWSPVCIRGFLFRWILARTNKITVLGPTQKFRLIQWGVPHEQINIVNNTCEAEIEKLTKIRMSTDAITLLYLGNLTERKGYREYLMALLQLIGMELNKKVYATICGQITRTSKERGVICPNTSEWIKEMMCRINSSSNVQVNWINEVYGEEKASLFSKSCVFVYPSQEDAQPIVLIEAMAAGCAVIASSFGEIPFMLADGGGDCLEDCSPKNVALAILELINNPKKLLNRQVSARHRFESQFSRGVYTDIWKGIFRDLCQR